MADQPVVPGTAPVTDRRPVPRGVVPRNIQTWLMAGLALGIVAIILLVGQPEAPAGPTTASAVSQAPNPDRVREYQDRLRALEAQSVREAQAAELAAQMPASYYEEPLAPQPEDPIAAERRRRDYESLFAGNVALSRRPDGDRPGAGAWFGRGGPEQSDPAGPSIDEIADAVVRASVRAGAGASPPGFPTTSSAQAGPSTAQAATNAPGRPATPARTGPISPMGPLHLVLEGTTIDTVLTNRLDGSVAAPVNLLVTNPVYSHSGQHVLIPAGARILGETSPVQGLGETRLAVALHRLLMPDGRTYSLDQFLGLNQIGDAGLRDQVNRHYWSTFGAAGAVGLISGLAQWLGTAGLGRGDGNRTVIIAGGATDATAQASLQVMNRFLNRLPTITIREGHRVKVYVTSDIELPAFDVPAVASRF